MHPSLDTLDPRSRQELERLLRRAAPWRPLPGPQRAALDNPADVLLFGGAAGGGKTDLAIGAALTRHKRSIIFRREAPQLAGVIDRLATVLRGRNGYNGAEKMWRLADGRKIEFGSCPHPGDESRFQGRPHDLKVFDEITHFQEGQFRFLCGWLRSEVPGQRQRVICTGNPPTNAEGRWVIGYWAPWLDPLHPNPAKPGELRWFAVLDGKDVEVSGPDPFDHGGERITPQSRSFIPSRVTDNPYLVETGYVRQLQALPEPLRSQMLMGDFKAGGEDSAWQVIPTAWVEAAQARWTPKSIRGPMDSMGVDVARGGRDEMIISRRHGSWFDDLIGLPGVEIPDGPTVAARVIAARRDQAPVHIDVVGWGASPFDFLRQNGVQVVAVNGAEASGGLDQSGRMRFRNKRAELWWRFREMLDPASDAGIALPPDSRLLADLCAPTWKFTVQGIQIESKEELIKRLGRSPDRGDAVVMAAMTTTKPRFDFTVGHAATEYDPYAR
ncbi:MAG: terminase [Magnetococcales bacterium]|nr:terminase [Magnetococcales bacterium]